jgi:hypothetical protein
LQRDSLTLAALEVIRVRRLHDPVPDDYVFNGRVFLDFNGQSHKVCAMSMWPLVRIGVGGFTRAVVVVPIAVPP